MATENNAVTREVGRWLRIGILTLATLGPVIDTLVARARERALALQRLKELPYSQEVLKRGEELVERGSQVSQTLVERGGRLSQVIVERGNELVVQGGSLAQRSSKASQALVERGSDITRELSERGGKLSQDLVKRSEEVTRKVTQRGRQATQQLTSHPAVFWLTFGIGLVATTIATYFFIRKRLLSSEKAQQDPVAQNGHLSGTMPTVVSTPETASVAKDGQLEVQAPQADLVAEEVRPTDSRIIGLMRTKHYYPADTPLDQLRDAEGEPLDIVYFSSEEDARAQGFSTAEE
jgi:hypothetical protein